LERENEKNRCENIKVSLFSRFDVYERKNLLESKLKSNKTVKALMRNLPSVSSRRETRRETAENKREIVIRFVSPFPFVRVSRDAAINQV
jgi:hypothetical protein